MWYPTKNSAEVKLKYMETTARMRDMSRAAGNEVEAAKLQEQLEQINARPVESFRAPTQADIDHMESKGIYSNEDDHYQFTL